MVWKWVWLALLLVVIAAAVWLLLRRPGGSEGVSGQDTSVLPGRDADAVPPSQAGDYAQGGYPQGPGAADGTGAGTATAAGAAYDQSGGYDQASGQEPAPFDQSAAATGEPYADPATADPAYGPAGGAEGAYQDAEQGAGYAEPAQDTVYEQDTTSQTGYAEPAQDTVYEQDGGYQTGYAEPAQETVYEQDGGYQSTDDTSTDAAYGSGEVGSAETAPEDTSGVEAPYEAPVTDYSQSAAYTDTATGETTEADMLDDAGPGTDTTYGEGAGYATPETDSGYAASETDTAYTPESDTQGTDDHGSGLSGDQVAAGAGAWAAQDATAETPTTQPPADASWDQGEPVQTAADFDTQAGQATTDTSYAAPTDDTTYAAPADDTTYAAPTDDTTYAAPADDTTYAAPVAADETATTEPVTADDYGYDEAQAGAAAGSYGQGPFGPGSAEPAEDGSGPVGWSIKGNAGSMLFHTPESPSYEAARAEVWFETEEAAKAAGFAHWDRKRR